METTEDVLARFPTGVAVVTAITDDGELVGLVTGTFTEVTASPPLIAFLAGSPAVRDKVRTASSFCVNVLAADQERLCRRFTSGRAAPFDGVGWHPAPSGAPVLDGVVSWLDCANVGGSEVGDQALVLGSVTSLKAERDVLPLLRFQHGYGTFAPGSLVTAEEDSFSQTATLTEAARDIIDLLARELAVECSVVACADQQAVFIATANHAASAGPTRLGFRAPIAPPLGTLFVGSAGAPSDAEWLARLGSDTTAYARDLARRQLDRARRRGWSVSLRGRFTVAELDEVVARYTRPDSTPHDADRLLAYAREMSAMHEVADIKDGDYYDVLQLAAPVRMPSGDVAAVLRLGNLPPHAAGTEVMFWVNQLLEAAATIERRLNRG